MPVRRTFTMSSEHDGLGLSVLEVAPDGEPKALVQLAHGMCEHKERYIPLMEYLAARGYACMMNDHRGHGASVRAQADLGYTYADGATGMIEDMHQLTQRFKAEYPGLPLYLFGHSMGALAVRAYCAKYDADIGGLIVCGSPGENPAVGAGLSLTRVLSALGGDRRVSRFVHRLVQGPFWKRYPHPETKNMWISANEDNVRAYDADPLCGFPFTLNGYRTLLTLMKAAYDPSAKARQPQMPVYFISGEDDPCAPDRKGFEAAMACMKARGYAHTEGKLFPGMRHEILNERESEQVCADIAAVLDRWRSETAGA